jgi:60 kDa SS-A/Ro ribonucleoprotein
MKFNAPITKSRTTNLAGGDAYAQSPELELVSFLLTSFVKDQYYQKESEVPKRVTDLLSKVKPDFAAKAAIFTRNEFNMRSISHIVAAELAEFAKGKLWAKNFYEKIVVRPDDITEILSYYFLPAKSLSEIKRSNKLETNAMRKGLGAAFGKFDKYQLSKYRSERNAISLVDAANILHPRTNDRNREALKLLIEGKLSNQNTWETKLTQAGQNADDETDKIALKGKAWSDLITEGKLGYMALLKNLRNIIEQAPEALDEALKQLADAEHVRKSRVLPFRFYTAYQEIQKLGSAQARKTLSALSKALDASFANIPKFDGNTLVVVDHSGSMGGGVGSNFQIGALFGVALAKSNNADFMYFGDTAKYRDIDLDGSTLSQLQGLDELNSGYGYSSRGKDYVGHGTNFSAIFDTANKPYERIIIFSDMQSWIGSTDQGVSKYQTRTGANPHIYSVDLAGHGSMQSPENRVYALAGFSEKMFDIMGLLEQDKKALVHKIEKVEL